MDFRKNSKVILIGALILAFILSVNLSACETGERVIRIGNQAVLSGEYEGFGLDQQISASLAVNELSPVEIGGYDYRIELVDMDDMGDPERAFLASRELVEQDVVAVIGSVFNGTTRASIPVYSEYNIPLVSPSAHGEDLSGAGNNFFRMVINNQQRAENIADFLIGKNPQNLIIVDNREQYSLNLADYLVDAINDEGIGVTRRHSMDFASEGYEVLAQNLVLDNPDLIFACMQYDQLANLIKHSREAGVQAGFVTEEFGMNDQINVLTSEKDLEGLLAVIPDPPSIARYTEDKKAVDFWRKFQAQTTKMDIEEDLDPGKYAPYSYDAVHIIINAMRRANSTNPTDILGELREISYEGVVGSIEFDQNGDRINPPSTVFVYTNGSWSRY